MTTAVAEAEMPLDATIEPDAPDLVEPDPMMDELRIGIEKLRAMSPKELRSVIASRVEMLETELKEREQRREAIQTAKLAARIYDLRHERSRRIHKTVNVGSAIAAVASTVLLIFVMV